MEPGPSSPKSGTKIQPVKKIILSTPAEQSFSTDAQAKLPVANTTKTITNNMSPTIKYVVLSANLPLDSSVTYDKNTTSQGSHSRDAAENTSMVSLDVYENKDVPENYYSIGFPSGASVIQGDNPGSYIATLNPRLFSIELEDIPDDSNVQLYTLTHTEPALKSSLLGYKLISAGQLSVGKNRAWDLTYTWKNSTEDLETMKVFIEGKDEAAVFTFSSPIQEFGRNNSTINTVLQSFNWL